MVDVAPGAGEAFVDRSRRLPDRQAQVPQHVEHIFDDLLAARRCLVGREKEQIDIRERREFAAPVAADGDQRQPIGRGGVGLGEDAPGGVVEQRRDQPVDEQGEAGGGRRPVGAGVEAAAQLRPPRLQGAPEAVENRRAVAGREFADGLAEGATVHDGALVLQHDGDRGAKGRGDYSRRRAAPATLIAARAHSAPAGGAGGLARDLGFEKHFHRPPDGGRRPAPELRLDPAPALEEHRRPQCVHRRGPRLAARYPSRRPVAGAGNGAPAPPARAPGETPSPASLSSARPTALRSPSATASARSSSATSEPSPTQASTSSSPIAAAAPTNDTSLSISDRAALRSPPSRAVSASSTAGAACLPSAASRSRTTWRQRHGVVLVAGDGGGVGGAFEQGAQPRPRSEGARLDDGERRFRRGDPEQRLAGRRRFVADAAQADQPPPAGHRQRGGLVGERARVGGDRRRREVGDAERVVESAGHRAPQALGAVADEAQIGAVEQHRRDPGGGARDETLGIGGPDVHSRPALSKWMASRAAISHAASRAARSAASRCATSVE